MKREAEHLKEKHHTAPVVALRPQMDTRPWLKTATLGQANSLEMRLDLAVLIANVERGTIGPQPRPPNRVVSLPNLYPLSPARRQRDAHPMQIKRKLFFSYRGPSMS